eukprot:2371259-Lingulodinium_polyedra.AAC.1
MALHGPHLAQLATGKGQTFADEFNQLLKDINWITVAVVGRASYPNMVALFEMGLLAVLHNAAGYHRRIWEPLCRPRPYDALC